MPKRTSRIALIVVIVVLSVSIVFCLLFHNVLIYSEKEYADKMATSTVEEVESAITRLRESLSDIWNDNYSSEVMSSSTKVAFSIDEHFAYENNFPYYKNLELTCDVAKSTDSSKYAISLYSLGEDVLDIYEMSENGNTFLSMPQLSDSYLKSSIDAADASATSDYDDILLYYLTQNAGLTSEEITSVLADLIKETIVYLPENCYLVEMSALGKADVMISATDYELARALSAALIHMNSNNALFQKAVGDYDISQVIEDLSEIDESSNNCYSFEISTNIFGVPTYYALSSIYNGEYNQIAVYPSKNNVIVNIRNNEKFTAEVKEYSDITFQVVYTRDHDKTYSGLITYKVGSKSGNIKFLDLTIKDGFIDGTLKVTIGDGVMTISSDTSEESILVDYVEDGDELMTLSVRSEQQSGDFLGDFEYFSGEEMASAETYLSSFTDSEYYSYLIKDVLKLPELNSFFSTLESMSNAEDSG